MHLHFGMYHRELEFFEIISARKLLKFHKSKLLIYEF